jgi:hypothetical protein
MGDFRTLPALVARFMTAVMCGPLLVGMPLARATNAQSLEQTEQVVMGILQSCQANAVAPSGVLLTASAHPLGTGANYRHADTRLFFGMRLRAEFRGQTRDEFIQYEAKLKDLDPRVEFTKADTGLEVVRYNCSAGGCVKITQFGPRDQKVTGSFLPLPACFGSKDRLARAMTHMITLAGGKRSAF